MGRHLLLAASSPPVQHSSVVERGVSVNLGEI